MLLKRFQSVFRTIQFDIILTFFENIIMLFIPNVLNMLF